MSRSGAKSMGQSGDKMTSYDLAVMGGGSGGFATALAAARGGARVLLAEPGPCLGGTSTLAGVNTWEPGVGTAVAEELFNLLARTPQAIGCSRTTKYWSAGEPWGLSRIDRTVAYEDSVRRAGLEPDRWRRVTFEPDAMAAAMSDLLVKTGRVDLRLGARFVSAEASGDRVRSVVISSAGKEERVEASFVADATGQIRVCSALGCETYLGCESRAQHGEPSAPETHQDRLNGVTVCFRVTPADVPGVEPLPVGVPDVERTGAISMTEYPCGDLNLNILPVMEGWEFRRLGEGAGYEACVGRVRQVWRWLQRDKGFDRYRLATVFPMTGIREGLRLVGRHVLTEGEVRQGGPGQKLSGRWIALADHALDVHGEGHLCRELSEPYGIPYECLLPKEFVNLIVPCRGASFSHIAAASCRLSRTMLALGSAAGLAVAQALRTGNSMPEIDLEAVRQQLRVVKDR